MTAHLHGSERGATAGKFHFVFHGGSSAKFSVFFFCWEWFYFRYTISKVQVGWTRTGSQKLARAGKNCLLKWVEIGKKYYRNWSINKRQGWLMWHLCYRILHKLKSQWILWLLSLATVQVVKTGLYLYLFQHLWMGDLLVAQDQPTLCSQLLSLFNHC